MHTLLMLYNQFGTEYVSTKNETLRRWLGETNEVSFQQRLKNDAEYAYFRSDNFKVVSLTGLANLIDEKRMTLTKTPLETIVNNTTISLLAQFGSAIIPLADVVEKFIGISYDTAIRQIKAGDLRLNIFRLSDRQKAPYLVHVDDLSALLEMKRAEAKTSLKECAALLARTRGEH